MTRENCVGREPLSRDRICEAALEAIDSDGLDCLSMRALADALGVKASSLYYHFSCKEALLTGVAEFLYRRLGRPPEDGEWDDQVKGTFLQLHDFVRSHPNAAPLLLRDLAYSPIAKKRAGVLMKLLGRAGLDPEVSATLIGNLVALLVGHTLLDVWVQQDGLSGVFDEPRGAGDSPGGFGVQSARPWVQKVLDGGGYGPTSGRSSESNAGFLAGLDALIKGFAGN
ncbi:MAG: TetR/AcrR family transcriptional regulator [Actinobacteria bacterium]|nr:TetR/AcrR family transcriptional regulator [Actinomycetota bacterium]